MTEPTQANSDRFQKRIDRLTAISEQKTQILEALGIDSDIHVKTLDLHMEAAVPITVTAEILYFDDDGELATVLEEYELQPKADAKAALAQRDEQEPA